MITTNCSSQCVISKPLPKWLNLWVVVKPWSFKDPERHNFRCLTSKQDFPLSSKLALVVISTRTNRPFSLAADLFMGTSEGDINFDTSGLEAQCAWEKHKVKRKAISWLTASTSMVSFLAVLIMVSQWTSHATATFHLDAVRDSF